MTLDLHVLSGSRAWREPEVRQAVVDHRPPRDERTAVRSAGRLDVSTRHASCVNGRHVDSGGSGGTNGTFVNGVRLSGERD